MTPVSPGSFFSVIIIVWKTTRKNCSYSTKNSMTRIATTAICLLVGNNLT